MILSKRRRLQLGFTLMEVMIALVITALIAAMAFQSLDGATRGAERTNEVLAEINQLDRVWQIIALDLRHVSGASSAASPAPGSGTGSGAGPTTGGTTGADVFFVGKSLGVSGDNADQVVLSFKRRGWVNFANLPRSDLQIVSYRIVDGKLWRDFLPEYNLSLQDIDMEEDSFHQLLLEDVDDFQLKFLSQATISSNGKSALEGNDFTRYWLDEWPDATRGASGMPLAVEVSIKRKSASKDERENQTKGVGTSARLFALFN